MQCQTVSSIRQFSGKRHFAAVALVAAALTAVAFTTSPAHAQTFDTVYTFPGGNKGVSASSLIFTPSGNLIGTAFYGTDSYLTFSLSPQGKETVLHRFTVPSGYESETPGGYVVSKDGSTLYGLSNYGGDYNACPEGLGCGFVFSIDLTTNKYKVLHQFKAGPGDGADPTGNLVLDTAGNLYGMAFSGGANYTGAIFKITTSGTESLIYSFGAAPDANYPAGGLVYHSGALYGASISGGNGPCNNGNQGCGAIFKVTTSGKETILYNFLGGSDGRYPYELVGDSSGNLYGVSRDTNNQVTDVFEVSSKGVFSNFYNGSDVNEVTSVTPGPTGILYATATGGNESGNCAPNGCGQILQLNSDNTASVLYVFNGTNGYGVTDYLIYRKGLIYGATAYGGEAQYGVIFSLKP
jgi:uncharacterized repeat protein (TIGR03803 family)